MPSDPILYRAFTNPWFINWMLAIVLPFLVWAVLAKLSRNHPEILPRSYPWLKGLAWGTYALFVASGLYSLFGASQRTFFGVSWTSGAFSSGINLVYHWVRRRVGPDAYKQSEDWRPTPKDLPEANASKNL